MLLLTKIFSLIILYVTFNFLPVSASESDSAFQDWVIEFKSSAQNKGVSNETLNLVFKNVKFLDQVIKYDRKQPEFFEDTITYINKRANKSRSRMARNLLKVNQKLFSEVEKNFYVEKEILLSLWGIETNFGKHVGKMDIISSLATLSFDKRRSEFFSNQLLTLIILVDKNLIEVDSLYGSWAGAYGNFQFMPSTIKNYALDYDNNNKIELKKSLSDSVASAANYINKIGWKKDQPCFYKVKLTKKINDRYINTSARNIKNKLKLSKWRSKGVLREDGLSFDNNLEAALILPDNNSSSPTYLVFENYEKILKWNRSLRFALSVCTLSRMIKL